ncbi:hypothetical protein CIB93_14430 [Streptomyces sp. WZ.A104]|nr:hypothetical protein CIB93_14430 [Streptomyces sp. WZ.A104]
MVLPFWRDLAKGFTISELGADIRAHRPDFNTKRDRLLHALGLAPASEEDAASRLLAVAARTTPDYVPLVPDDNHLPYEPLFEDCDS